MARPRQFDEDRALDAAARAFWSAGYEATSTQDLCDATGLGRGSIYNTFSCKRELFDRAWERYQAANDAVLAELLGDDRPVVEQVRAMLRRVIDPAPDDPPGCLTVNATVELAPHDPELAARLQRAYDRRVESIRAAIERGVRGGELPAGADAAALAHFLQATVAGLQVMACGGVGRAVREAAAEVAVATLAAGGAAATA